MMLLLLIAEDANAGCGQTQVPTGLHRLLSGMIVIHMDPYG